MNQHPQVPPKMFEENFRSYLNQWDLLTVKTGVLYKQWNEHDSDLELRVIVPPKKLCRELFHHLHELRTGGHLWIKRTVYQLERRFYRTDLQSDVYT